MEDLIQLHVVSLSPSSAGASSYILFLQADLTNQLGFPMVIGLNEAQAISMFIEDIIPTRPLSHDLFANFILTAGITVNYIEISSFQDGIFYAKIHASNQINNFVVDARPSDSIALALRLNVPIQIHISLLNEIAIPMDSFQTNDSEELDSNKTIDIESMVDEISSLEELLTKALAEENYEEAAKLRDQLNQLTK